MKIRRKPHEFSKCKSRGCGNPICRDNKTGFCRSCNQQQDVNGLPTPEEILTLAAEIRSKRPKKAQQEEYKRMIGTYRQPKVCKAH